MSNKLRYTFLKVKQKSVNINTISAATFPKDAFLMVGLKAP